MALTTLVFAPTRCRAALSGLTEAHNWRFQCLLNGPAFVKTTFNKALRQMKGAIPLRRGTSLSAPSQETIGPRVVALGSAISPAAVLRPIVSVVVDAIKRESVRARTHIREEVLEGVYPPSVHADASASVRRIIGPMLAVAASLRFLPREIFACLAGSVGASSQTSEFGPKTTATPRGSVRQGSTRNPAHRLAITAAQPSPTPVEPMLARGPVNHSPASEGHSGLNRQCFIHAEIISLEACRCH